MSKKIVYAGNAVLEKEKRVEEHHQKIVFISYLKKYPKVSQHQPHFTSYYVKPVKLFSWEKKHEM